MRRIILVLVLGLMILKVVNAQTVHPEDTYVKGSMAIGTEVTNPIDFGYNTLIFREDNLRILFDDTSTTGNFSFNDWAIILNEKENGGDSFFRIDDVTGGFEPFKIMAGSRTNAIVTKGNYVGFGTDDPQQHLHVSYGNNPTIRLEQPNDFGWGEHIWDIVANETNFVVRDAGKFPFRIGPDQESDVLTLKNNNVGIGTWEPSATLHLNGFMRFEPMNAAPDTPGAGDLYFDETSSELRVYDGTNWLNLGMDTDSQELSLSSNILSISGGTGTIDLSDYLDNTDSQTLALSNNNLSVSNGNMVDLSSYLDNTDAQELSISTAHVLSISNGTNTFDLSDYLDNTDSQELFVSSNVLSISGGVNTIDLSAYLDNTDSQTLSLSGTSLSIDNGNSVDLSSYLDNTDAQELSVSSHVLSITNGTNTFDLSAYLDNTDSQSLSLSGTSLSIDNGNSVDLSSYLDNTDAQELSISSHVLSITNGTNTFDLSAYLDNTDSQNLNLSGTSLSIDNGNSVDLSSYLDNTDAQNINLSGTLLSIDNGNSVDLSTLLGEANTDEQSLSISGTTLTIENGNSVDLSSVAAVVADDQELNLSGTTLSIENGNSVDLNSLLEDIYNRLDAQESKIEEQENTIAQLQTEVAYLKSLHNNDDTETPSSGAMLYQNYPNPTNGTTRIDYFLPETVSQASLVIHDLNGRLHKSIPLNNKGKGSVEIAGSEFINGQYLYTLLVNGSIIETKKMLILK